MTDWNRLWSWVETRFDVPAYTDVKDLIEDVKDDFIATGSVYPFGAEDTIRENYAKVYNERWAGTTELERNEIMAMERMRTERQAEQKQIAEFIGSGEIPRSLSDEIIESYQKPEIMGVDIEELKTTRETVVPPEVRKFYTPDRNTFFGRIAAGFRRIFRWR